VGMPLRGCDDRIEAGERYLCDLTETASIGHARWTAGSLGGVGRMLPGARVFARAEALGWGMDGVC